MKPPQPDTATEPEPPATTMPAAASAPLLPPIEPAHSWVVVLDPAWIEGTGETPEVAAAIRPALVQIAERCVALLRDEGTIEAALLSEHDERTSPDLILEWIARQSPDVAILLRFETSALRTQPGYTIYYADSSVDWQEPASTGAAKTATGLIPRALSYQAFQRDSRRLAENVASGFAALPGFRDRRVLPAPLYVLKRCPARAVMVVWSFPEHSPEIARLADSGFREGLARALAGAVIAFRRENAGS
ncbi:MAG: N-acetylmuramoyl-L-alanine amidase, partial [Candidatus Sumerlaeia bacterium]|nr:N-acetylmuramoyl-L-alanine amidase [Candidatus Sumerlaeia bacterium]